MRVSPGGRLRAVGGPSLDPMTTPVRTPTSRRGGSAATDPPPNRRRPATADLVAASAGLLLLLGCAWWGRRLNAAGVELLLPWPPIIGFWHPHLGPGTPLVVVVAAAVWWLAGRAQRWPWRRLLLTGWVLGLAWIIGLTLVDGDWTPILESWHEYLTEVPRVGDPASFLATFTDHIIDGPGAWTTHVSAHPPLATLFYWALDAVGLRGGWWAGLATMVIGSAAGPSLAVTVHALGADRTARRLVPLMAVFPGAVWMGVSADGMFAGVGCLGLALASVALVRGRIVPGLLGGVLLGALLHLSYGHVLFGLAVPVVLLLAVAGRSSGGAGNWRRGVRAVMPALAAVVGGTASVIAGFLVLGFNWFEGLSALHIRYYQGIASQRPAEFFVVNNLAALVLMASPLIVVAARRALPAAGAGDPARWLALSGLAMIVVADLTLLSKGETERIWLTFALLLWCGLAPRLGHLRLLVVLAAGWAVMVNHLLATGW